MGFNTERNTEWSIFPPQEWIKIPNIPATENKHAVDLGNKQILLSLLKTVNIKGKQHSSGAMLNEDCGYKINFHTPFCTTQHLCYYWLTTSNAYITHTLPSVIHFLDIAEPSWLEAPRSSKVLANIYQSTWSMSQKY